MLSQEVLRQQGRDDFIKYLYRRSGRTCGTYSGLWQQFKAELLDNFAQPLAEAERDNWLHDQSHNSNA